MSRAQALTPKVTGVLFAVATGITAAVGVSLLLPGSVLDAMWRIKPEEHQQLLRAGNLAAIGFIGLAAIMGVTSLGAFRRRRWAWRLALIVFAVNGVGDAVRIAFGAPVEGAVGVAVVASILLWLTRPHVRDLFDQ